MKPMNVYVLTLSKVFPVSHPKAGKPTYFKGKLENAHVVQYDPQEKDSWVHIVAPEPEPLLKIHTIRGNYELWRKRFDEIEEGKACISLRQWTGKPYASKQVEIARLTKEDGIGCQLLCFAGNFTKKDRYLSRPIVGGVREIRAQELAMNDGLTFRDWLEWFSDKNYDLSKPMVIIQLTKYRY